VNPGVGRPRILNSYKEKKFLKGGEIIEFKSNENVPRHPTKSRASEPLEKRRLSRGIPHGHGARGGRLTDILMRGWSEEKPYKDISFSNGKKRCVDLGERGPPSVSRERQRGGSEGVGFDGRA